MLRICMLALCIAAFACATDNIGTDGTYVGGPCTSANQCDAVCQLGGDFPQGMCTRTCVNEDDCPGGTHCIDKEGGICELACHSSSDCRDGYSCDPKGIKGGGGEALVCAN